MPIKSCMTNVFALWLLPRVSPLALGLLFTVCGAQAQVSAELSAIQKQWAQVNYVATQDDRAELFKALSARCDLYMQSQPQDAGGLTWCGIIKSTYAGAAGGLGALKIAKAAKADFETAIEMDSAVLDGAAHTSLGTLYSKVPGWPVGFGSDKKAEAHLRMGLELGPEGIDANYFMGDFLYEEGDEDAAKTYLLKAQRADPRPGREVADSGRQAEIAVLLDKIES